MCSRLPEAEMAPADSFPPESSHSAGIGPGKGAGGRGCAKVREGARRCAEAPGQASGQLGGSRRLSGAPHAPAEDFSGKRVAEQRFL